MDVHVLTHPLALARLTTMRDERSSNAVFRAALNDLSTMLIYEACRDYPIAEFPITTPMAPTSGYRLEKPPIIVPVLRAGLGMVDAALSMIPEATVGFVGLARDEQTHLPVPYLEALPENLAGWPVLVVDPMLATGGSMLHACRLLVDHGADDITVVSILAAEAGIAALRDSGLPVRVVTGVVDPELNEDAYIVPGLGDAGDRLYGPRYIG